MTVDTRLLIVDDEPAILFALWDYLARCGYTVDRARSRQEAERLLAQASYQLIVADLRLGTAEPRGGLEVLRHARRHQPWARMILLTAYGSAEVEAEVAGIEAVRLLSKPQPLARIAEEIVALLSVGPDSGRSVRNPEAPELP
ncbi:MAG TPA: response regulator [Thermoanaerobaculia bacterium]|nr:response regulator [Thermoanaerobaculia bacterium]